MFRRIGILMVFVLMMVIMGVVQVSADASVGSFFEGCSSFFVSGTTDAPFIGVQVFDPLTGDSLFHDTFPVGDDGTFEHRVTFPTQEVGHKLFYFAYGSTSADPNDYDLGVLFGDFENATPCQQEPVKKELGSPGIPDGFAFASIICNTPVYNTPAGQPVGDAAVTAGQTWYVNTKPVDGDDGEQWTEIYVSSTTNPYVPTVCVQ